jgi:hypothetical protein
MNYTYDEEVFSDLYKDTFGFRPRGHEFWTAAPERKQEIWDRLCGAHENEMKRYHEEQQRSINEFEELVSNTLAYGNSADRETAIRWILQTIDDQEMLEQYGSAYACYHFNLPYSYEKEFDAAQKK